VIKKLLITSSYIIFTFSFVQAKDKGIELFNDKKFAEAVEYYKSVLEARKDDPPATFGLGSSSYYNNDIESALKSFEKILYASDKALQAKALYNIARILQDQNQIDKSLSLYKKSLELNPNDIDSKINYEILKNISKQDQQNADNQEGEQDQQNADNQEGGQDQQNADNQEGEQGQQNADNQEGEQDQQNADNQENKKEEQKKKEGLETLANKEPQIEKEKSDQMIQAEAILNAIKGQEKINQKHKILKSKAYKYDKDW